MNLAPAPASALNELQFRQSVLNLLRSFSEEGIEEVRKRIEDSLKISGELVESYGKAVAIIEQAEILKKNLAGREKELATSLEIISRREKKLAVDNQDYAKLVDRLEQKQVELDGLAAAHEGKVKDLDARERTLRAQENELKTRLSELGIRESKLIAREGVINKAHTMIASG